MKNRLVETIMVMDTELRKQKEADRIVSSVYAHKLPRLKMISSRVGSILQKTSDSYPPILPNPIEWRHLLATSSFRSPVSPVILVLLLDPFPIKQLLAGLHALFLSLLMQDLSIGLRMLLDLSPIDLSVRYIMPVLEWTQTFPWDLL